jgi:hypothetical protein
MMFLQQKLKLMGLLQYVIYIKKIERWFKKVNGWKILPIYIYSSNSKLENFTFRDTEKKSVKLKKLNNNNNFFKK